MDYDGEGFNEGHKGRMNDSCLPSQNLGLCVAAGCSPVFACVLGFTETGLIPVFQQLVLPQKPVNTLRSQMLSFVQRSPVPAPISLATAPRWSFPVLISVL